MRERTERIRGQQPARFFPFLESVREVAWRAPRAGFQLHWKKPVPASGRVSVVASLAARCG